MPMQSPDIKIFIWDGQVDKIVDKVVRVVERLNAAQSWETKYIRSPTKLLLASKFR
jgi:hypothetical protein